MDRTNPVFPQFNRLVVLICCSGMLFGLVRLLVRLNARGGINLADGFFLVVFSVMACWGIWFGVRWPSRRLDPRDIVPTTCRPTLPDNAIVCQFFTGLRTGTVVVEPDTAMLHFDYCHVPNTFLAVAQPTFSCSLANIQDFYTYRARAVSLTIRTTTGKAVIPGHATNYDQLVAFLQRTVSVPSVSLGMDHPLLGLAYVLGAFGGLFAGVYLAPPQAKDGELALFAIVGGFLGILASRLLAVLVHRYTNLRFARPIGYAAIGFGIGLTMAISIAPFLQWNVIAIVAPTAAGFLLGLLWGLRSTRPSDLR